MLIMGIDPGTLNMGVAVLKVDLGSFSPIFYDVLSLSSKESIPNRIAKIFKYLSVLLDKYDVDAVSIEDIFSSYNHRSALKLGQARGAAIAAVKNKGLDVFEYTAKAVKLSVCGYGGADKEQVKRIVEMLLGVKLTGKYDITDALAIAICHANHSKLNGVLDDRLS